MGENKVLPQFLRFSLWYELKRFNLRSESYWWHHGVTNINKNQIVVCKTYITHFANLLTVLAGRLCFSRDGVNASFRLTTRLEPKIVSRGHRASQAVWDIMKIKLLDPFSPNVLFLYPLKMSWIIIQTHIRNTDSYSDSDSENLHISLSNPWFYPNVIKVSQRVANDQIIARKTSLQTSVILLIIWGVSST